MLQGHVSCHVVLFDPGDQWALRVPSPAVDEAAVERVAQFSSLDMSVGVETKLSWRAESSGLATCGAISSFCSHGVPIKSEKCTSGWATMHCQSKVTVQQ
jgi:hypothetical protein